MIKKILTIIVVFVIGIIGGYQYGTYQVQDDGEWAAWNLEQAENEVKAIYHLLEASAFTDRTNMNMAFKTNQYIEKVMEEQGIDPTIDKEVLIERLEYLVENMPEMDGANKMHFYRFYVLNLQRLKSEE